MGIIIIFLSLVLLIAPSFKKVPVCVTALCASIFCLILAPLTGATAGTGFIDFIISGMTGAEASFLTSFKEYIINNIAVFLVIAALGVLYEISGADDAIAEIIVERLGSKAIIPMIFLIGVLISFGGLSGFLALFLMGPITISLFKEGDIPRYMFSPVCLAGIGISFIWVPGAEQHGILFPAAVTGVAIHQWSIQGIILAILETIAIVMFVRYYIQHIRMNGEHYELTETDKEIILTKDYSSRVNWITAVIPMIVLLVLVKLVKISLLFSVLTSILVAVIFFNKTLRASYFLKVVEKNIKEGALFLINTAAIIGFTYIIQFIPTYRSLGGLIANFVLK